jgi:hypothetical protein
MTKERSFDGFTDANNLCIQKYFAKKFANVRNMEGTDK